jgi:riboflavin kinase/FMN adenylyltransferase
LDLKYGVLPPSGVYAGRAYYRGRHYTAAIAVGTSPTFSHSLNLKPRLEVHLIDFSGNIYGRELEIEISAYIREERCFSSAETLKKQIAADLRRIRKILISPGIRTGTKT